MFVRLKDLVCNSIRLDPYDGVEKLAEDIRIHGLRNMIDLEKRGDKFHVVDGIKRVHALLILGYTEIEIRSVAPVFEPFVGYLPK